MANKSAAELLRARLKGLPPPPSSSLVGGGTGGSGSVAVKAEPVDANGGANEKAKSCGEGRVRGLGF